MTNSSFDRDDVEVLKRETVYQGFYRLDRYELRHRLFAGGFGAAIDREVLERGDAVAVLPYDPVRDEVVMIEQFRIGGYVNGEAAWMLEIPAGAVDDGEHAEAAARREALEEASLHLSQLWPVLRYYSSPGTLSERIIVYCAPVDASGAGGVHGLDDENEDIRVVVVPFADAMAAIDDGRIVASPAVIALQWLALNRDRLRNEQRDMRAPA